MRAYGERRTRGQAVPAQRQRAVGAESETALVEATGAWRPWRLRPCVLRGVSEVRLATARGATAAGAFMTVSTSATYTLEEVAEVSGHSPACFQLYRLHSLCHTDDLARFRKSRVCCAATTPSAACRPARRRSGSQPTATGDTDGVSRVRTSLSEELAHTMALCRLADAGAVPHDTVTRPT